jgi:polyisoprenoid-binding protein YceI
MSTDTRTATQIPAGTWTVDPVHSSATFTAKHMMVGTFRGEFTRIDGWLSDGKLVGRVKVDSIQVKDTGLKEHLLSPEFFDAERYPEIVYESATVDVQDGVLSSTGTLTIKDRTTGITAVGTLAGPVVTLGDVEKIGIDLKAIVAREAVGLRWNAPLPDGGVVLGPHVTIAVSLELALADDEG